jgi:hypothetical protein
VEAVPITASEAPVAVQATAMLVIFGVLALLVAFLVRRSRVRAREKRKDHEQAIARLPQEYRPQLPRQWLWVTGYLVTSAAVGLVRGLVSFEAALVLSCVTFLPGTFVLFRTAAGRNRRIIESVRSRAAQLDSKSLIGLVDDLEAVYGADMKPLRTLLPAGSEAYTTA